MGSQCLWEVDRKVLGYRLTESIEQRSLIRFRSRRATFQRFNQARVVVLHVPERDDPPSTPSSLQSGTVAAKQAGNGSKVG